VSERKDLIQDFVPVQAADLLNAVADLKTAGYRLGQACATVIGDDIEVMYSFDKDVVLKNLVVTIGKSVPELQSVTGLYWYAFIYENEMHDLFGITFKNLALDYKGQFFKIAEETPWNKGANAAKSVVEVAPATDDTDVATETTKGDE
jgi:ech hydrogenase subunit D